MKLKDNATLSIAAAVSDVLEGKVKEEGKYPHDMFHPETGEKEVAKDEAEHKALSDKGYTHEKPEVDEVAEPKAKGEKDFKAKHTVKKSGAKEDGSVVKENKDLEEKVDPKELASDIPEMELSKFLKKATKAKAAYFDGANLVASKKTKWADKTTLAGALDPKKKYTVQDLIKAIETMKEEVEEETIDEAVDKKLLKKAVDIALKMGGNMTGAVKKIEKLKKGLSKDKEVAAALQLANEEVTEQVVEEAYGMNKKKTKMQEDKERYQKFFKAALKKFGVTSPGELEGEKKKEFFDYVDKNYEADNESD